MPTCYLTFFWYPTRTRPIFKKKTTSWALIAGRMVMSSHYIVLFEPLQCVSFSSGPSIIINWPECLRTQKLRLPWWSDGGIYGRPTKSRIPNWRMWRWWQRRRSDWESYRIGIQRSSWHTDWRAHTLAATSKHLLRTNKPLRFSVAQQVDCIFTFFQTYHSQKSRKQAT